MALNQTNLVIFILFFEFALHLNLVDCRPRSQRIVLNGHRWIVPDDPKWKHILEELEPFRQKYLNNCETMRDCLMAAEKMRQIYLKYAANEKFEENLENNPDIQSVFKWG